MCYLRNLVIVKLSTIYEGVLGTKSARLDNHLDMRHVDGSILMRQYIFT